MRSSLTDAGLGSIIYAESHLRTIDFASMNDLWEAAFKAYVNSQGSGSANQLKPNVVSSITEALQAMPDVIHAHFLTGEGLLWSSLQTANLTIPTTDLTLKYGGTISGVWKVLYILDAWPDSGEAPDVSIWSGGQMIDGILAAIHGLRVMMGRPSGWFGITPLMIFRDVRGWLPTVQNKS